MPFDKFFYVSTSFIFCIGLRFNIIIIINTDFGLKFEYDDAYPKKEKSFRSYFMNL